MLCSRRRGSRRRGWVWYENLKMWVEISPKAQNDRRMVWALLDNSKGKRPCADLR